MSEIMSFEKFTELWNQEPIVIPDTNAILDLYRYSSTASEHVLQLYNLIVELIWIPHQVNMEFHNTYRSVIAQEKRKYSDVPNQVSIITQKAKNSINERFNRYRGFDYPNINELANIIETKLNEIETEAKVFQDKVKDEIEKNTLILENGDVKSFMDLMLQEGKVGQPFNYRESIALYTEGDSRYLRRIPPGFKDEVKDKNDPSKTQKFGDLVVWKQLLKQAEESESPVIFITNDNKTDWWVLEDNRPKAPRPELIEEFTSYSDQPFEMTSLGEFSKHLAKTLQIQNIEAYFELNGDTVVEDFMSEYGWQEKLDDKMDLTAYLIHSGDLQEYVSNTLTDVEVYEVNNGTVFIDTVQYDKVSKVTLGGVFSTTAQIIVTENCDYNLDGEVTIDGHIMVSFEIEDENEEKIIDDTIKIKLNGFGVAGFTENVDDEEPEWSKKRALAYCPSCNEYKSPSEFRGGLCIQCDD